MDALNQVIDGSAPTTWRTVFTSIYYYSTLPIVVLFSTILNILLVVFSPLIHLLSYVTHLLLLPLSIFGKLETLYIYFGIASLIGLLTGAILYSFSNILVSVFDINSPIADNGGISKSVGARRQGTGKLESVSQTDEIATKTEELPWYGEPLKRASVDYLDKGRGGKGLSSEIILEEDSEGSRF